MKMTKKSGVILLVSAAMLISATSIMISKRNQQAANDLLPVDLHAFKINDGWGYEVMVDKKVYIHQDCIPVIPTFKRFASESEALLVGNKVVDKIKRGHKPSLTIQEINDAHIHY